MEGKLESIIKAIKKIMICVESLDNKSKERKNEDKSTVKFVFPEKSIGFMIGKNGYFI